MKNFDQSEDRFLKSRRFNQGISPVISSLLLVLIVLLMCGGFFIYATGWMGTNDLSALKPIKIEIENVSCGNHADDSVRFQNNILILKNSGGNAVPIDNVSLKIIGKGDAYQGIPGQNGKMVSGDIEILYTHLNISDKNPNYQKMNAEMLKDGYWSPGEKLILTGNDSKNSTVSSVFVGIDGNFSTSNNYGLAAGETIEITAFQTNPKNIQKIIFKNRFLIPKK
ncbi:hypothetical protein [Methanolapillus millepedarum]|uniref:Archaeal Type IV pilin N-terminal domain-containing protein n=1 Tax=Methanolapillus millepedarum TaxID=3028296 RepID=A0AA96ZVQ7_9EURY|nr:hypothetical protein MsAc7_12740 [Methanosarcinaceae archaeon Ac7]